MKNKKQDKIINFEEIRPRILAELDKRFESMGISESVSLVDGFVSQPFTMELSSTYVIGGPIIPMIMLVGEDSGRIYFFALRAILKDIIDEEI